MPAARRRSVDLVVLGGGAAGLAAARAGRWQGASVVLISDAPLGGDCTFTGCVPSKTLIEASRQGLGFEAALDRVEAVVSAIAATESADVMQSEGVEVVEGRGRFVAPRVVEVEGRSIVARRVIIATGTRPALPPISGLADTPFRTNEGFFERRRLPRAMVVVGAGPVGCELGEAMARFGTDVTIVEVLPRVLAGFEPDASAAVEASMTRRGIRVLTGRAARATGHDGSGFVVELDDGTRLTGDELLVATGRRPNTEDLGLADVGIEVDDRGHVVTDRWLRATTRGVFAAGDVNGRHFLSSAADEMGRVAAWSALRRGRRYAYDPDRVPQVVFTTPEVASIGVSEADAPPSARVAEAPMAINDRAVAADRTGGFVRLIAKPGLATRHAAGGKLIGATIVGERAGELINECALVIRSNAYAGRLAQTVRAYPSWSTVMQKAAARWFYEIEGQRARPPRR